jgi:hypothetical protein
MSLAQEPDSARRGAGLTLSANVTPASILEISSKSNYIEQLDAVSTSVCALRVVLPNSETADVVKQTAGGRLLMTRVEFLIRFSGFKEETATVVITVPTFDEQNAHLSLVEGTSEEGFKTLQPGQVIKFEGLRSGARIVRYIGFLVDETTSGASQNKPLQAAVTYELIN